MFVSRDNNNLPTKYLKKDVKMGEKRVQLIHVVKPNLIAESLASFWWWKYPENKCKTTAWEERDMTQQKWGTRFDETKQNHHRWKYFSSSKN